MVDPTRLRCCQSLLSTSLSADPPRVGSGSPGAQPVPVPNRHPAKLQVAEKSEMHVPKLPEEHGRAGQEKAARVPHAGLREGVQKDVAPEGTPEGAHRRAAVRLHLDVLREELHALR